MEITIKAEKDNKVLSRKEVVARIHYQGVTPSRKEVQEAVAKKLDAKADMTIIRTIQNQFGDTAAEAVAVIYSDEKVMLANERKNLVEKHAGREPKTEEAAE